jgi:hypothetical protein
MFKPMRMKRATTAEGGLTPAQQSLSPRTARARRLMVVTAIGTALLALGRWYTLPASPATTGTLLDQVLPDAEFNGAVSVVIHAPPSAIFQALCEVTLADMPLAKVIGELRYLPARLTGKATAETQDTKPFMQLVMSGGGTIVLAEKPNRELVVGSVGQYHNLTDQQIAPLNSPTDFLTFDQPDCQKLAMSFRLTGDNPTTGYTFTLEHRTHALSPAARWKFALYWLGIKPGGNFVSWLMLRAIKRRAEALETRTAIHAYSS